MKNIPQSSARILPTMNCSIRSNHHFHTKEAKKNLSTLLRQMHTMNNIHIMSDNTPNKHHYKHSSTALLQYKYFKYNPPSLPLLSQTHSYSHSFSTSSSFSSPNTNTNTNTNTNSIHPKEIKLKQIIRPFLLTYHPDRLQNATNIAKQENLKAIQTLHEMIDTIDHIYHRAMDETQLTNATTATTRMELKSKYTIEFLVPSNDDTPTSSSSSKTKQKEAISTRRSVDLIFTKQEQAMVESIDAKKGTYSKTAAKIVQLKAVKEIGKLLQVAGLEIPDSYEDVLEVMERDVKDDALYRRELMDIHDQMILDELDLGGDVGSGMGGGGGRFEYESSRYGEGRRKAKSEYEKSRERYMRKVDWKEHARLYDEAMEDMKRDLATDGLIKMDESRKQRFVSEIISRVRIYDKSMDSSNTNTNTNQSQNENQVDNEMVVDPLQQLIAIRRMSLIFTDNFEKLEMEDMGKMWENISIVLTPERSKGSGKTGAPFSRRKRLREGKESGFKFAYHDEGKMSVYVPIDFLDDELISELNRHLEDFYDLCVGDVLKKFLPKNYDKTFAGHPRIE